jgi:hypothetical protein
MMRVVAPKRPAFQRRSIAAEDIIATAISGGDRLPRAALEKLKPRPAPWAGRQNDVHIHKERGGGICVSCLSGDEEESEYDALSSQEA